MPDVDVKVDMKLISKIGLPLALGCLVFLSSCGKHDESASIKLPPTPILTPQNQWGVVNAEHLRLRKQPSVDSAAIFTLWRGYEVEILDRSPATESVGEIRDYWYDVNYGGLRGWVFGYYLDLYDSKSQADLAAKEME